MKESSQQSEAGPGDAAEHKEPAKVSSKTRERMIVAGEKDMPQEEFEQQKVMCLEVVQLLQELVLPQGNSSNFERASLSEEQCMRASPEALQRELAMFSFEAGRLLPAENEFITRGREIIIRLGQFKADSKEGILQVSALLRDAIAASTLVKKIRAELPFIRARGAILYEVYRAKKLREVAFASEEEFSKKRDEVNLKIYSLRNRWFGAGALMLRKQIHGFAEERKKLVALDQHLREMRPAIPDSYQTYDREVNATIATVADLAVTKIAEYYNKMLTVSHEVPEETLLLDREVVREINDEFIAQQVVPFMEKKEGSHASPATEKKVIALFYEAAATKFRTEWDEPEEVKGQAQKIEQEIQKLPYSLQGIFSQFIRRTNKPSDMQYQDMARLAKDLPWYRKLSALFEFKIKILEKLKKINWSPAVPKEIQWQQYPWEEKFRNFQRNEHLEKSVEWLNRVVPGMDEKRWEVFRQSGAVREALFSNSKNGEDALREADEFLGNQILEKLFWQRGHTENSNALGQKLLSFQSTEVIPWVLLNAYRESGHSGERPFLSIHHESRDSLLFQYLASLPQEKLEELKHADIPGLLLTIELIRNHPDSFNNRTVKDGADNEQDNPLYQEIQQGLLSLASYYFAKGEHKYRYYLMDLFPRLSVDLGGLYEELSLLLKDNQERDPDFRARLLDCLLMRCQDGDLKATLILSDGYKTLSPEWQARMRTDMLSLLSRFVTQKSDPSPAIFEAIGQVWQRPSEDVGALFRYLRKLEEWYQYPFIDNNRESVSRYFEIAKSQETLDVIASLVPFGYRATSDDSFFLFELARDQEKKENLLSSLRQLRELFPDFQYNPPLGKDVELHDPYELLARTYMGKQEFYKQILAQIQGEKAISREIIDGLFRYLRKIDPLLANTDRSFIIPEERYQTFRQGFEKFLQIFYAEQAQGDVPVDLLDLHLLHFAARQPERFDEINRLPELVPYLMELIRRGGPLFSNRDHILSDVFGNGDFLRRAKEIASIFTKKVPYWKQLFFFTDFRLGEKLAQATSEYPISKIAGVPLTRLVSRHIRIKKMNPGMLTRLESVVGGDERVVAELVSGARGHLKFSELSGVYKRVVFRDYLQRVIEISRSPKAKAEADLRNRMQTNQEFALRPGLYLHGSAVDHLSSVLLSGNLPKEALGEGAKEDAYPFHVDFTAVEQEFLSEQQSTQQYLLHSLSSGYGVSGMLGIEGQIFYVYERQRSTWEPNVAYGPEKKHHKLSLGGVPATEVSAIILRAPEKTLDLARRSIAENGFYIPLYDMAGKCLFTSQEYDDIVEELNLRVPIATWDYSMKSGEQLGSNPGGQFLIQGKKRPVKYYVKFMRQDTPEHIWSEQLADMIYRQLDIPVPETQIVRIEGTYGHASRWLEGAENRSPAEVKNLPLWNKGFLADALLANWDIPFAPDRNIMVGQDGTVFRSDNGGALLFHAKGKRKGPELFGEKVREIKMGSDHERLGEGMLQEYPGLTKEDMIKQAFELKQKLSDITIDRLVDGVRLAKHDRDYLKLTLRKRRDYILNAFGAAD